jgi:CBS domain-containing protein
MTTHVVSVREDTPIYDAIRDIVESNVTGLPVVNDDMTITGIVSEKDMLRVLFNFEVANGKKPTSSKVKNYMTSNVVTVDHEDNLMRVCNCLMDNQFRRVPVLAEGKLGGVITRADIMKCI